MSKSKRQIEIEKLEADVAKARAKWPEHFKRLDAKRKKEGRAKIAKICRDALHHLNAD